MTRTPFLAANFKMFKTVHEAVAYAKEFRALVKNLDDVEIVVAPPFTALHAVAEASRNSIVGVAGQDVYWEKEGAFTGEVSAGMLKEAGAEFAIVGHSERRRMFGDTDEVVNRKTLAAIQGGLCPIVCVGETLEEREANRTLEVLDRQVKAGLDGLSAEQVADLVLAYEPVWAIGTGRNATPGAGRRGARPYPRAAEAVVRGGRGREVPHPLRRQRQAGQRGGPGRAARHRRRPGRRRQPGSARFRQDRHQFPGRPPRRPKVTSASSPASRGRAAVY